MSILNDYGKFKRYLLTDAGYQLCSQWTSSNTVHFDDGKTAQDKLGAINGITDSLTSGSSDFALSAKAGKNLQEQISELNTGIVKRKIPCIAAYAATIDEYLDNYSKYLGYRIHYEQVLDFYDAHPVFEGGEYYLEGYIKSNDYEWQILKSYPNRDIDGIRVFARSKTCGTWRAWVKLSPL